MPAITDFPARGKVTALRDGGVVFEPYNTNYQFHLGTSAQYDGPMNSPVFCLIKVTARRAWTVASGGNFVSPLFGPPRTIQGRVKYADETTLVVHAGMPIVVELPKDEIAIDLTHGAMSVGMMINVLAFPGATMEFVGVPSVAAV
jgi:hypothetical protein